MTNTESVMDLEVSIISPDKNEYVKIGCHEVDERVQEIARFVKLRQGNIEGERDGDKYNIPISDIYYIESVDDRTFIYLKSTVYQTHRRLYDLEEVMQPYHYVRISKSIIVNLMKVGSIKPALNGRFSCQLRNGEEVIISRKYVPEVKAKLRGEKA